MIPVLWTFSRKYFWVILPVDNDLTLSNNLDLLGPALFSLVLSRHRLVFTKFWTEHYVSWFYLFIYLSWWWHDCRITWWCVQCITKRQEKQVWNWIIKNVEFPFWEMKVKIISIPRMVSKNESQKWISFEKSSNRKVT